MNQNNRFRLIEERHIPEINSLARLFKHEKTGARVLSMTNQDENKVFGISFRTPPRDNTGVAHILEHSVLCGSRKYRVKEPFVELLKSSVQTFLNAVTFPDKTCYPVASQNRQDLYNLMDVYLDAVFFPGIPPEVFAQEGWHYELPSLDSPLKFKGVVYNEMKGAYSSPESLLAEYSQQSLFPGGTYGLDSGGNPEEILNLTYEDFLQFHKKFYHPSNSWIFFYGDDPEQERLDRVGDFLDHFDLLEVDSQIRTQPPVQLEKQVERCYSATSESNQGYYLTINWMLPTTNFPQLNLGLRILEFILTGMPASPLRKRLIESGLGEDLAGVGLETDILQMYYSTGMKGVLPENLDPVQNLIQDTLQDLAQNGIDPEIIKAALSSVEFALRENNTGSFPRGLAVMFRALSTWLYDESPFPLLEFGDVLEQIKLRLEQGEKVFEDLLQEHFLNNPHKTLVILKPDPDMEGRIQNMENQRLQEARKKLDRQQEKELVDNTLKLIQWQEKPDDPLELARIPRLKRSDMNPQIRTVARQEHQIHGAVVLTHPQPTAGIFYLDLGMDLHFLPQKHLSYIPLFARALLEMGTFSEDYTALTTRIRQLTGGIVPVPFSHSVLGGQESACRLFLRGKSLPEKVGDMFGIFQDILTQVKLDNRDRFRQIALEEKSGMEQALVPAGHRVVGMRLKARYSEADWAQEHMSGVSYLLFLRHLLQKIDTDWEQVLADLEDIKTLLVHKNGALLNLTAEQEALQQGLEYVKVFLDRLPEQEALRSKWKWSCTPGNEAMFIPARVNYVGRSVDLETAGYRFHGASLAATRFLRASWLWDKIRVQGGAYGAFSSYDHFCNVMAFTSYRDPNITSTLQAFDSSGAFLCNRDLDPEEVEKAVIGAIGEMDGYQLPDAKGFSSMIRYLSNISDDYRQKVRNEILEAGLEDFQKFGRALDRALNKDKGVISILGGRDQIAEHEAELQLENSFRLL